MNEHKSKNKGTHKICITAYMLKTTVDKIKKLARTRQQSACQFISEIIEKHFQQLESEANNN